MPKTKPRFTERQREVLGKMVEGWGLFHVASRGWWLMEPTDDGEDIKIHGNVVVGLQSWGKGAIKVTDKSKVSTRFTLTPLGREAVESEGAKT